MGGSGLHWIDYVLIVASVVGTIYMGIYFSKRQKSSEDYFAGGDTFLGNWDVHFCHIDQ